jgi:hypothetical protein
VHVQVAAVEDDLLGDVLELGGEGLHGEAV